jgi:hypothetical protein
VRICERREVDFIQRYVFPGGMLPSPQVLKSLGERFGIPVIRERIFRQDHAMTLGIQRSNFCAAWPSLMRLGFMTSGLHQIARDTCDSSLACAPRGGPLGSPDQQATTGNIST